MVMWIFRILICIILPLNLAAQNGIEALLKISDAMSEEKDMVTLTISYAFHDGVVESMKRKYFMSKKMFCAKERDKLYILDKRYMLLLNNEDSTITVQKNMNSDPLSKRMGAYASQWVDALKEYANSKQAQITLNIKDSSGLKELRIDLLSEYAPYKFSRLLYEGNSYKLHEAYYEYGDRSFEHFNLQGTPSSVKASYEYQPLTADFINECSISQIATIENEGVSLINDYRKYRLINLITLFDEMD